MIKRPLYQLGRQSWVIRLVITDNPNPGEDYLPKDDVKSVVLSELANIDPSLEAQIDSIETMHSYNPAGEPPKV